MRLIDADALMNEIRNSDDARLDTIEAFLDMQPTIEPNKANCWGCKCEKLENNWIPVSERLPSDYGNYLVSTNDDRVLECDIGTYCDWDGKWNGCDANGFVRGIDVVAWMPLPEPYKVGDNE